MDGLMLTNFSLKGKRRELDYYPTPQLVTIALMEFLLLHNIINPEMTCIEPACGEGKMSNILQCYFNNPVFSCDIYNYGFGTVADYLNTYVSPYGCLITNPPFKDSQKFIEKALKEKHQVVAMLLKSQYWHSQKRASLYMENFPAYVLPLTWRPDFDGRGKPTMEVLWTVWTRGKKNAQYIPLKKPSHVF